MRACSGDSSTDPKDIVKVDGKDYELLEQKIDTVFIEKTIEVPKYVPKYITKVETVTVEVPADVDSLKVVEDYYAKYIVKDILKLIVPKSKNLNNRKIIILGLTFKENCSDTRNSKVFDIYDLLKKNKIKVDIFDPKLDDKLLYGKQKIKLVKNIKKNEYNGMIVAVAHNEFIKIGVVKLRNMLKKNSFIYDLKSIFKKDEVEGQL